MTHVLMTPVMRAISTMRIVAVAVAVAAAVVVVAGADDTMTAHVIMSVGTATMTGAHAIMTEGMDANHGNTIAAMMIGDIEP